jgi:hypothetical protein
VRGFLARFQRAVFICSGPGGSAQGTRATTGYSPCTPSACLLSDGKPASQVLHKDVWINSDPEEKTIERIDMKPISFSKTIVATLAALGLYVAVSAQSDELVTHVAALKQNIANSKQQLKQYQWTETQVVFHDGEEKSQKQYLCRYGPDGTVQKTLISASPEKDEHGLRGHIIEKKKEEVTEYMDRAANLVKLYVPPDPAQLQLVKDAGNASLNWIQPGERVRVVFRNYRLPGDSLAIDFNPKTQRILGLTVETYLDDPKDTVGLKTQFGTLPDGTTMYPSVTDLNAQKKHITIQTRNSNYTKKTS